MFLYVKEDNYDDFFELFDMLIYLNKYYKDYCKVLFEIDEELESYFKEALKFGENAKKFNSDNEKKQLITTLLVDRIQSVRKTKKLDIECDESLRKYIETGLCNSICLLSFNDLNTEYSVSSKDEKIVGFNYSNYKELAKKYLIFKPNNQKHHPNSKRNAPDLFSLNENQRLLFMSKTNFEIFDYDISEIFSYNRWNYNDGHLVAFKRTENYTYHSYEADDDNRKDYVRAKKHFGLK